MKTVILIAALLAIGGPISAQEELFIRAYGGNGADRGVHIIESSDGHLVIVGNTTTPSQKLDVWMMKCTTAGDTLWTRKFGGKEDDNGWCVKETAAGDFIIVGFTQSYGASGNDILLIKTDSDGTELWKKTIGGDGDDIGWSIALNDDGGYSIAAQTDSYGEGALDAYLVRTDGQGDTLWTRTYGGSDVDRVFSVGVALDGSILIAGITYSFGAGDRDAYLVKTDGMGNLQWQKTYGGGGYDNAHSVIIDRGNRIMLVGYGDHWDRAGKRDMFLKQVTMDGDELWTESYGGAENDHAMTVFQTGNGGYVLTGYSYSFGNGDTDAYIVRTNESGKLLWDQNYGTRFPDSGYDIIQVAEGEFYITGQSHGFGDAEGDLLLIGLGN
ncbi:MAG: hypothetical protein HOH43_03340 [Candidatus Latescibacteria bacterium]|nr:hypothetical protein [Candidatus Latescibacterota bacterium]